MKRTATTIKLSGEEILSLFDALAWHRERNLSAEEIDVNERLSKRLQRAYDRVG